MRSLTAIMLAALLILALAAAAHAEDFSLLGGRVAFTAPGDWLIQGRDQGDASESLVLIVPFAPTAGTEAVATATFAAWDNPEQMDAEEFVTPMLEETLELPGSTLISDAGDETWRLTFLRADHEGTPYLVAECYALTPQTMAWFRLEWPDVAPEREAVLALGNQVLGSLQVDGALAPPSLRLDPGTLPGE